MLSSSYVPKSEREREREAEAEVKPLVYSVEKAKPKNYQKKEDKELVVMVVGGPGGDGIFI